MVRKAFIFFLALTLLASCYKAELEPQFESPSDEISFRFGEAYDSEPEELKGSDPFRASSDDGSIELFLCADKVVPDLKSAPVTTATLAQRYGTRGVRMYGIYSLDRDRITDGTSMDNIEGKVLDGVFRYGSSVWTCSSRPKWPSGDKAAFDFVGFAPADCQGMSGFSFKRPAGSTYALQFHYEIPLNATAEDDILVGYGKDVEKTSDGAVSMTFGHALASVRFQVKNIIGCKVKSISFDNVYSEGDCQIRSNGEVQWQNRTAKQTFSQDFNVDIDDTYADTTVARGGLDPDGSKTFLMIPQQLTDSRLTVTLEVENPDTKQKSDKVVSMMLSSLAQKSWQPNQSYIYDISTDPKSINWSYELNSTVSGDDSTYVFSYTGGESTLVLESFKYRSYNSSKSLGRQLVPCTVWVSTDGGHFYEKLGSTKDGVSQDYDNGKFHLSASQDASTGKVSVNIKAYQPEITSGYSSDDGIGESYDLWDLSTFGGVVGDDASRSTSNTYVVNTTGEFILPCVYGNSIKNGSLNAASYNAASYTPGPITGSTEAFDFGAGTVFDLYGLYNTPLRPFVGADNAPIMSPLIEGITGAELVWQEYPGSEIVSGISTEGGTITVDGVEKTCTFLRFSVPNKKQGNALIAVKGANGILWSWQIWVTDYKIGTDIRTHGNYSFLPKNLGWVNVSTFDYYKPYECHIKITQEGSGLNQEGTVHTKKVFATRDSHSTSIPEGRHTVYQWGRKDPFPTYTGTKTGSGAACYSSSKWVNTNSSRQDYGAANPFPETKESNSVSYYVKNPSYFFMSNSSYANPLSVNLWDATITMRDESREDNVKSVYDPCPPGYKVPVKKVINSIKGKTGTVKVDETHPENCGFTVEGDFYPIGFCLNNSATLTAKYVETTPYGFYFTASQISTRDSSGNEKFPNLSVSMAVPRLTSQNAIAFSDRPASAAFPLRCVREN